MALVVVDDEDSGLQLMHGAIHCYKTTAIRKASRVTFRPIMMRVVFALFLAFAAVDASADRGRGQDGRDQQRQMSREERQRMREDVRDAYRHDRQGREDRQDRQQRSRQMSPEERGQLRRDIEDANRQIRR